jgi:DivIVA domain-containing protein
MNESDRRQRVISSAPRLTVEEVANRSFAKGVRGYSETEVRAFLKRVADELATARGQEQSLEAAIDALEEQVRTPRPLSEQELLDALGEETARLLRSAREASDDIRKKAEERAARLVDDAAAAAERARAEATEQLAARSAEVDAKTAEMIAAAESHAAATVESATVEAEAIVDNARHQLREMLDEAKSARERVVGDLVRRRSLLTAQIEALRAGRDHLLDAYRTVKRTFLDATEALAQVEARAAEERSASNHETIDVAAEIAAEIERLDGAAAGAGTDATAVDTPPVDATGEGEPDEHVQLVPNTPADDAETEVAAALADVDSLFARLRAGHEESAPSGREAGAGANGSGGPRCSAQEWRARRAKVIDPLLAPLVKRAKRRAQDDQNALLDSVRRHKGRPSSEQVLTDAGSARDGWVKVVRDAVDRAYGEGRTAAGASSEVVSDDLAGELADAVVGPLRERLIIAIDSGDEGDTGGLVERIGARYREWKNQSLERTLSEVLATAWTRGVYDAVPDEAVMWWVPFEEGRCSDCDDNALEPTVKGKEFPTGQAFPPAHPGCKCLLAPADLLEGR